MGWNAVPCHAMMGCGAVAATVLCDTLRAHRQREVGHKTGRGERALVGEEEAGTAAGAGGV